MTRALCFGLAATVLALTTPSVAQACSCGAVAALLWPADGVTVPPNTLVVAESDCERLLAFGHQLSVWVDGVEAALVDSSADGASHSHGLVIEPTPVEGAEVQVSNCGTQQQCAESTWPLARWVSFTIGAADNVPPVVPSVSSLAYDLVTAPLECGENPTPARDWSVGIEGSAEPLLYEVSVGPQGEEPSVRVAYVEAGDEDLEIVVRRLAEDAGSDVCATVRVFDMAGNEAESASSCHELAQDETLKDSGCACSTSGSRGGSRVGWTGLLLGLWAFRRRRRSSRSGS
ncbi:MAG: hypothetical protein JKY37_23435 [Nannocystaceae bacterium]|nr:hypothetical protein [Nannocystaceae bacterium]